MEIILSSISTLFSAVIPFITLLGILIFVHELGHFLVARWCGVRVEVFSLGFGKKIFQFKRGDTVYALSLIPLGGYVKMFGEQNGGAVAPEEQQFSFTHKNVWQRIAVVIAGPLMNFLFAIVILFAVGLIGEDQRAPVVGDIPANSAAYNAGFRPGDRILLVDGKAIKSMEDVLRRLQLAEKEDLKVQVQVQREFTKEVVELNPTFTAVDNPNVLSKYDYVAQLEGFDAFAAGTTIGVIPDSIFASLGVKTGSKILSVNDTEVKTWRDLSQIFTKVDPSAPIYFKIQQPGSEEISDLNFSPSSMSGMSSSNLGYETSDLYLAAVVKGSPAEKAGLQALDRLVAINGKEIKVWEDVLNEIRSSEGKPAKIVVLRGKDRLEKEIAPKMTSHMTAHGTEEKRYTIGISPLINYAAPDVVKIRAESVASALVHGVEKTWDISVMTVLSFVRLFQGMISPKNIGGVISIGQAAHETYKMGFVQFLQMMAIISVNLFILNLLPVPVLDGGHLVFYTIELLKGTPLSMRKMEVAQQVGLALLMSLMVFALFNDFTRVLGL